MVDIEDYEDFIRERYNPATYGGGAKISSALLFQEGVYISRQEIDRFVRKQRDKWVKTPIAEDDEQYEEDAEYEEGPYQALPSNALGLCGDQANSRYYQPSTDLPQYLDQGGVHDPGQHPGQHITGDEPSSSIQPEPSADCTGLGGGVQPATAEQCGEALREIYGHHIDIHSRTAAAILETDYRVKVPYREVREYAIKMGWRHRETGQRRAPNS